MIDGIIQNVFEKFKQEYFFSPSILTCIEKHEQELIAEIEKKFANKNVEKFTCSIFSLVELRRLLIGDNQE